MNDCERNFSEFMHQQINHIERLRRWLVRHQGSEITPEQAALVWINRGYAGLFRRHFETRYRYHPAYLEIYPQTDFQVSIKADQNTVMIRFEEVSVPN
jgi:hypothetical protein